jgi:RNA polymerase sigma factor
MTGTDADGGEIAYDPADPRPAADNPLRLEIEAIKADSMAFGIDFFALEKVSPKAEKTKAAVLSAVRYLSRSAKLLSAFRASGGNLPLKEITENTAADRKTLKRHRQYIVVATLIVTGDYPYLSEYIGIKSAGGAR